MREILFRGKRYDNGEWVEGYFLNDRDGAFYICPAVSDITYGDNGNRRRIGCWYAVDPETVGQYIGFDKNGKRIFEGDIGKYKQTDGAKRNEKPIICIGKVIYNAKTVSFAVESKDETGCKYFDYFPIKDFEVIGNIHDNPELLEDKQ